MAEFELSKADREVLRGQLVADRERGEERPLIPLDVDLDGDGVTDAWGLDENDQIVLVSGASLIDTAYVSDGDDAIEHEAE